MVQEKHEDELQDVQEEGQTVQVYDVGVVPLVLLPLVTLTSIR